MVFLSTASLVIGLALRQVLHTRTDYFSGCCRFGGQGNYQMAAGEYVSVIHRRF